MFANEGNRDKFVRDPRKYLQAPPAMPENYRLMMLGPRGCGVRSHAAKLEQFYGWKVVDFMQVVQDKLREILAMPSKYPNNICFDDGPCMVSMSNEELEAVKEGKVMATWKFLPWILEFLDIPLMVKPKPVVKDEPPNFEEMTPEQQKAYNQQQKAKAEAAKKKQKEMEAEEARKADRAQKRAAAIANGEDPAELGLLSSDEELKIEDLSIEELGMALDEEGKPVKEVGAFILIGFPQTDEHVKKLKEYGLGFDRVLFLTDNSEEDPGKEIRERMNLIDDTAYDWDEELAAARKILDTVKAAQIPVGPGTSEEPPEEVPFIEESAVLEIDCTGSEARVFTKIRTALDPFFVQADNPEEVRVSADLDPEDEKYKPLPRSDFGDYCPVTFVDSGFMVKGNPEHESTVFGKTFLFAGEKEQETFKFDPSKYLVAQTGKASLPLSPPPPKIMICGLKGSGVTTQIRMLCEKFKLEEFELLKEYLARQKSELQKRQRLRLLERGFKPMPIDEETGQKEPDQEILDDPDDFDKEAHERELM